MEQATVIGTIVLALATVIGFITSIVNLVKPINELRIAIQKLNDNLEHIKNENSGRDERIKKNTEDIKKLNDRMYKVERDIAVYHSGNEE